MKKRKRRKPKSRNVWAAGLAQPQFQQQKIRNKKKEKLEKIKAREDLSGLAI